MGEKSKGKEQTKKRKNKQYSKNLRLISFI